jgi:PD-(D/E)XK endonuclease
MSRQSSHMEGLVGEAKFIGFAAAQGWHIFRGMDGHERYDYVVDTGTHLYRVEVKSSSSVQASHRNYYYVTASKLNDVEYDYLFYATPDGDYWIPRAAVPSRTLSLKQVGGVYKRNITAPGKYEQYRVQ